jgi:type II secretory pathway pseudopilin PulG
MRVSRGFTLIEITVALGIIIAMVVMLGALVKVSVLQKTAQSEEIALTAATAEMENLRVGGYSALPASGSFSNTALSSLSGGSGSVAVTVYDAKTKKVEVTVSWTAHDGVSHSMTLSTLITQTGGLR